MKKLIYLLMILWVLYPVVGKAHESPFDGGIGTIDEPYKVSTVAQLNAVRDYPDAFFEQTADIDLTGHLTDNGWVPIGSDSKKFNGSFDGGDFSILGLWIMNGKNWTGLFGYISETGVLKNIHVEIVSPGIIGEYHVGGISGYNYGGNISGCKVTIADDAVIKGTWNVGGLLGANMNDGIIDNCSVTGRIEAIDVAGDDIVVGGLVGWNKGSISNSTTTGEVYGSGQYAFVGGLVGDNGNYYAASIISSSTVVQVIGKGYGASVGGLAGTSYGPIMDSFSEGTVDAEGQSAYVGGLVGLSQYSISRSYASGDVTVVGDAVYVGGLAGSVTGVDEEPESGSLIYSFASGNVVVNGTNSYIGGLVGSNGIMSWDEVEHISYCYASGSITADGDGNLVGGLVGISEAPVRTCYSVGAIEATGDNVLAGGIIGGIYSGFTVNSSSYIQGRITNKDLFGVGGRRSGSKNIPYTSDTYSTTLYNFVVVPHTGTELKLESNYPRKYWKFLEKADKYDNNSPADVWLIAEEVTSPYLWWQDKYFPEPQDDPDEPDPNPDPLPEPECYDITLEVASGIRLVNITPGIHSIGEGEHIYFSFCPEDPDCTGEDILFLVNGVEAPFKKGKDNSLCSYLKVIDCSLTIVIALRDYTVTLPEIPGVAINWGVGNHRVAFGQSFSFTLTPESEQDLENIHVYADEEELVPDSITITRSLAYTIDKITSDMVIRVEGLQSTSNLSVNRTSVNISADKGLLIVGNTTGKEIDLAVYKLTGQVYMKRRLPEGTNMMEIPQGIYIVKTENLTTKVVIK